MQQIRTAIIGTSSIARAHIRAITEMGERVRAVAALDVDRARVETFCTTYDPTFPPHGERRDGQFRHSALSPRQASFVRIDFQRATVELSCIYSPRNSDWRYSISDKATHTDDLARWQHIPEDVPSSHIPHLASLLDDMERGERPFVSGNEVRRTIEFVSALYKSAVTGEPVRQGSIVPGDPFYDRLSGTAGQQATAAR